MAIAIDGSQVPDVLPALLCGGVPRFDYDSGYSYRCDKCFATVGSIGMPRHCKDLMGADEALRRGAA